MSELPFQAEYAKSGRASCKGCKNKIDQGALRLAVMVQSAFHDGKQPNWYHEECFLLKQRPKSVDEIGKFNMLQNADQKRIKQAIENSDGGVVLPTEKKGKGKAAKRVNAQSSAALKDFGIEYSKSSRAACKVCELKIVKDEVRVRKTVFDTEIGQKYGGQALWHHLKCFAEVRGELLFLASGEDLPGFNSLKKEDQKIVKEEIKPMKMDEVPVKKLKEEPKDEQQLKEEKALEKKIEKQNELFHKYRNALSELTKFQLKDLLEANSQDVYAGVDECLNHLADCMAFGALGPCSECKEVKLVLENYGYKCTGNVSEWTKCQNVTKDPKRVPFKVPKELKSMAAFKKYKPKVGVRLFTAVQQPTLVVVKKDEPGESSQKPKPVAPLKNLRFFIYGKMSRGKDEVKKSILKMGGIVERDLDDSVVAVISTKREAERTSMRMDQARVREIEVVEETFLDLIDKDKGTISETLELIKLHNIADWGSDPAKRVPQDVIDGKSIPKSGSMYTKSKSGVTKLKVKGGSAVDPQSNLEDEAHVYKDQDGTKWTVVLNKTDIVAKKNSYYKLQLLESDSAKSYWIFKSWGRTGTNIGGHNVTACDSLHAAKLMFESLYLDKTSNPWHQRHNFVKVPDGYYPVDMDYGEDMDENLKKLTVDKNSKLHVSVQQLVCKIFDVNRMKKTLLEFELDAEKMPLGKLSKKQIMAGYKVLSELLDMLEKGNANQTKIVDATNRFFTLIPHDFGIENPPVLDDVELIKKKTEMLDNLLEIEIAYSMLTATKKDSSDDNDFVPVDAHYLKLKAEIEPIDKNAPEYKLMLTYVENTHADTHRMYKLEVEQIFRVVRENEEKRYKPFKKLHNRRLLWHGSRTTNFTGIISQGLRIAPPEAPVTGYMFGKGIYFADMVSKSANYCCTNASDPVGFMMLCEVALGDMKECYQAEHVTKLPPGKHSVWGLGRTEPDPSQNHVLENGTIVPLGKPINKTIPTPLLYNEFIVYDVAQVHVKYLLQMKFNYYY